uniref:60S ribosomal protein L28 n=1 Tax=Ascaris lumbricoides TaxID=6252 RepID=A0A0M3HNK9_ASCLU
MFYCTVRARNVLHTSSRTRLAVNVAHLLTNEKMVCAPISGLSAKKRARLRRARFDNPKLTPYHHTSFLS